MNRDEALSLADRILALINGQPSTPSREQIADAMLVGGDADVILSYDDKTGDLLNVYRKLSPSKPIPSEPLGAEFGFACVYERVEQEPMVLARLHDDAARALPPATRYEIRKKYTGAGEPMGMCWYRDERCSSPSNTDNQPHRSAGSCQAGGYILVGQFSTPASEPSS